MAPLAIDVLPLVGTLSVVFVVGLLLLVASPWRHKDDAALDDDVQARLLLGEDPADIDRDLEGRSDGAAPVAELRPDE